MRVLGMSSGTSVDGIDLAVAEFERDADALALRPIGAFELAWDPALQRELLGVLPPAASDVGQWCRLNTETGRAFGQAARTAIERFGPVDLICSHGQTLFHDVADGVCRGTLQIGEPAEIYAATGVPVVANVRAADIAAGGQGAPLISLLDALWLGDRPTAALNLGGIANITIVGADDFVCGDTGPANCLIDAAMNARGESCDRDGAAAARGNVDDGALARLLADPYFARAMPKSTGREYFDGSYVARVVGDDAPAGDDLIATLTEFTARTVADALAPYAVERLVVSGGGLHNPTLMARIEELTGLSAVPAGSFGLPEDAKEAYLFALLGYLSVNGWPGTAARADGTAVTGARVPVVLGNLTPPAALRGDAPARLRVPSA